MAIKKVRTSDLRKGMFVDRVDSEWLSAPWIMSQFRIASEKDVRKLQEYDIRHVFIDTSKGPDLFEAEEIPHEGASGLRLGETFEASLDEFWVNHQMPVDIYRQKNGGLDLLMKKGLPYSEEAEELFRSSGVTMARIPKTQKHFFDAYKRSLETEKESRRKDGYEGLYADPVKVDEYLRAKRAFHSVDPMALQPGTRMGFDLYIRSEVGAAFVLGKGATLTEETRQEWLDKRLEIVIRNEDKKAYQAYLLSLSEKPKEEKVRAAIVRENSKIIVADLAKNPRSKKLLKKTKTTVVDITNLVIDNPATFYGLIKIQEYDYDTYTHSVNVAAMSTALALADGVSSKEDLEALGLGAILHDIGKSKVDHSIINKPGRLTPEEYVIAKNHVLLGFELIKDNKQIPELSKIPLLQHHEKLTGGGYPHGLSGDQIHLFGRIAALIDIYDALTTKRPYKRSLRPFDALSLISRAIDDYDKDLYYLFVNMMHKQRL